MNVPEVLQGSDDINDWYTERGVQDAQIHLIMMRNGTQAQQNQARRFYEQVKLGYNEKELGPSPKIRHLEEKYLTIDYRLQSMQNYLGLNEESQPILDAPPDLGSEGLNRIISFMTQRFDAIEGRFEGRFDAIEGRFDALESRFDTLESRFDLLEKRENSTSARFDNKFKAGGGAPGTTNAYKPIINNEYKYPSDNLLEDITSLRQLNDLNASDITKYLNFYGLSTSGSLQDKKLRLMLFIGINIEFLQTPV